MQGRAKTVHFILVKQLLSGKMHEEKPISERRKAYKGRRWEKALAGEKRAPLRGERLARGDSFFHLILPFWQDFSLGRRAWPGVRNGTQNIGLHNNTNRVIIALSNLYTMVKLSNYNN